MNYFLFSFVMVGFLTFFLMIQPSDELSQINSENYKFTDAKGNPYHVYETRQRILFSQDILNNRNYTLIGDTELKVDDKSRDFYEIILAQRFEIPVGDIFSPSTEWTPKQPGFYALSIITNYNNPPGKTEGFVVHEESSDHIIVVDKISKAYSANQKCKTDYQPITKENYSSLNCVSKDTFMVLHQRGWHPI